MWTRPEGRRPNAAYSAGWPSSFVSMRMRRAVRSSRLARSSSGRSSCLTKVAATAAVRRAKKVMPARITSAPIARPSARRVRKFGQPHRSPGCREIECANPAARLRRELPTRRAQRRSALLITGAQRPARAVGCQHLRSACKSSISLVANRVLTTHKVVIRGVCPSRRRWSRCRDDQPLSFSGSSAWGRQRSVPPANPSDPAL